MPRMSDCARAVIETKWRGEWWRAIQFCSFAAVLQAVVAVVLYALFGRQMEGTGELLRGCVFALVVPVGWLLPIVFVAMWFRRRSFRRDLAEGGFRQVHGLIERVELSKDFDSGTPKDEQFVTIRGVEKRLTIPLAYWRELPDSLRSECEYFAHSKIVYRIAGETVWGDNASACGRSEDAV